MTTPERVKELRGYLENHAKEPREWWISTDEATDLLAILDDYEWDSYRLLKQLELEREDYAALKAEVERLRAENDRSESLNKHLYASREFWCKRSQESDVNARKIAAYLEKKI